MAKKAIFWVMLVIAFTMAACDDGIDPRSRDPYTPPPSQPGDSASNPINRIADINLGTMTSPASGWRQLLNSINSTGKYINLDLSTCTMTGTSFNPDATVETGKKYIVSIILPTVATSIEAGTFSNPTFKNFSNLRSASGANITTIGDYSFGGNILSVAMFLNSVNFPKATTIGKYAFAYTFLESINFPQVTTIGDSAFSSTSLKNANFPLVQSIGIDAFQRCSLQSISFPASAQLGYSSSSDTYSNPFTYCDRLTSFTLTGSGSLSVIENGKVLVRNGTILLSYPSASGNVTMNNITSLDGKVFYARSELTGINFPQVTSIGSSAFCYCDNIQDVSFPLATNIGFGAFSDCSRLQSASFPLVTTIGSQALRCSNLLTLNIPKVTSIDNAAFFPGNITLTITMGSTAPTLSYEIFSGITTAKTVKVKVPSGATGYTPFSSSAVTVSGTNTTANWANGFRGGGWNGSTWAQYGGTSYINQNISLTIEQQ